MGRSHKGERPWLDAAGVTFPTEATGIRGPDASKRTKREVPGCVGGPQATNPIKGLPLSDLDRLRQSWPGGRPRIGRPGPAVPGQFRVSRNPRSLLSGSVVLAPEGERQEQRQDRQPKGNEEATCVRAGFLDSGGV